MLRYIIITLFIHLTSYIVDPLKIQLFAMLNRDGDKISIDWTYGLADRLLFFLLNTNGSKITFTLKVAEFAKTIFWSFWMVDSL